jgi:hypothetical protein
MCRQQGIVATLLFVLVVLIVTSSSNSLAQSLDKKPPIEKQRVACKRDLWIIDTHAVRDGDCDASKARFLRLEDNCKWIEENEDVFLKTLAPEQTLNIILPGYSTTMKWVVQHLWNLSHQLERQARCRGMECPPTRLVIVGWPSEIDRVPLLRDAREKAQRAELEGYWVAQLIAKLPKDYRVNLVAYSFGSRIATSAAHYLAGGQRCDCPSTASPDSPRLTAVLMAAAVDADWLSDCQPHGLALSRFERVLLLNNSADPVLRRFYKALSRPERSSAIGSVGLLLPEAQFASQVRQWDVSSLLGRTHDLRSYVETPEIMWAVAEYAFFIEENSIKPD